MDNLKETGLSKRIHHLGMVYQAENKQYYTYNTITVIFIA